MIEPGLLSVANANYDLPPARAGGARRKGSPRSKARRYDFEHIAAPES